MCYFSHNISLLYTFIFPGWEHCEVYLPRGRCLGWIKSFLIPSEGIISFHHYCYVIIGNLYKSHCSYLHMGRMTLNLPLKVSVITKWNNVSENTLENMKCYLNKWKKVFLLLLLVSCHHGNILSLRNLLILVCPYCLKKR